MQAEIVSRKEERIATAGRKMRDRRKRREAPGAASPLPWIGGGPVFGPGWGGWPLSVPALLLRCTRRLRGGGNWDVLRGRFGRWSGRRLCPGFSRKAVLQCRQRLLIHLLWGTGVDSSQASTCVRWGCCRLRSLPGKQQRDCEHATHAAASHSHLPLQSPSSEVASVIVTSPTRPAVCCSFSQAIVLGLEVASAILWPPELDPRALVIQPMIRGPICRGPGKHLRCRLLLECVIDRPE